MDYKFESVEAFRQRMLELNEKNSQSFLELLDHFIEVVFQKQIIVSSSCCQKVLKRNILECFKLERMNQHLFTFLNEAFLEIKDHKKEIEGIRISSRDDLCVSVQKMFMPQLKEGEFKILTVKQIKQLIGGIQDPEQSNLYFGSWIIHFNLPKFEQFRFWQLEGLPLKISKRKNKIQIKMHLEIIQEEIYEFPYYYESIALQKDEHNYKNMKIVRTYYSCELSPSKNMQILKKFAEQYELKIFNTKKTPSK